MVDRAQMVPVLRDVTEMTRVAHAVRLATVLLIASLPARVGLGQASGGVAPWVAGGGRPPGIQRVIGFTLARGNPDELPGSVVVPGCGNDICEPDETEAECPADCVMKCKERNTSYFVLNGRELPLPDDTGAQPSACSVRSIVLMGSGSQPDFSGDGRLIAFTDLVAGDYEVFVMQADGSARTCVTCGVSGPPELVHKHKGKPTFYPPDSRYLLISVENEHGDHGPTTAPGIGDDHDLWLVNLEHRTFWRLTALPAGAAIQYPRFSDDGSRLLWSERYQKDQGAVWEKGCEWGFWKLKLAGFSLSNEGPSLTGALELAPAGRGYYEPHGFDRGSNQRLIMTAMIRTAKSALYGEIYTYDLASHELVLLAGSEGTHYEMALYSPSGARVSFMAGPFIGFSGGPYKADLYLMDRDGHNRVRLTYFNDPGHPEYAGAAVQMQKVSWNPGGSRMVSAYLNHTTNDSTLFMLSFQGACGKEALLRRRLLRATGAG